MSRMLSELLGAPEPDFSLMIKQLERSSGHPSVDVGLTAEIAAANIKLKKLLNLDVRDTTGPELYHSLLLLLQKHDELLTRALIGAESSHQDKLLSSVQITIKKLSLPGKCWALKPAAAKRLLKALPPKNVMKHLGYRSIDSMLKREKTSEIMAAISFMESPNWLQRFKSKYKSLSASDFEDREIDIFILSASKWGNAAHEYAVLKRRNLVCVKEVGSIGILPLPTEHLRGLSITLLMLLISCIQQVRMFSAYSKIMQVRANFGLLVAQAAHGHYESAISLSGHEIPWSVLQRYFGSGDSTHNQLFEPHVRKEDLLWYSPTDAIISLNSVLNFWKNSEHLGTTFTDGVVSFNLLDTAINYCNNVPYHKRIVYYMREALWQELYARYLRQPNLEQEVIRQMEININQ